MQNSFQVLMVNRSNATLVPGGDVIQMQKTADALRRLGIHVTIRLTDQLREETDRYDLVHVFNIQTADDSEQAFEWARARHIPIALSPIYWDPLPAWFGDDDSLKPFWRRVKQVMGYHVGLRFYSAWQRHRPRTRGSAWQTQRRLLLAADVILPNAYAEAQVLVRDFRLPRSWLRRIKIVPNAIDGALFANKVEPPDGFLDSVGGPGYVLEVGRVSPEKNNLRLLQALWDVDIPIVFVGQPSPYHADYVAECREAGRTRGKVHFVDHLSHDLLPGIYQAAAVHALPSWRETPGLASLEAAAAGCRIVSTCIGSAREYFGDDARYCHPADVKSIRSAVLEALNSTPSSGLRQRMLENYTWEKAVEATLNAYRSVLEG